MLGKKVCGILATEIGGWLCQEGEGEQLGQRQQHLVHLQSSEVDRAGSHVKTHVPPTPLHVEGEGSPPSVLAAHIFNTPAVFFKEQ